LEGGHQSSEDLYISLFPDFPGCNGKNYHEESYMAVLLCLLDRVKELEVVIPINTKIVPTPRAEGALEDKMIG
jgi:hypothetical protein